MRQKSCPGTSLTSLLGRVASLQRQVSVLHKGKQTAISSMNEWKKDKIKLASELQLAHQRLQISKQMAKVRNVLCLACNRKIITGIITVLK